jgi:hypothetical protein
VLVSYHRHKAEVDAAIAAETAALAEFSRKLDAAPDDDARLAIIAATDPTLVAEWRWRLTATVDDWRRRYLHLAGCDGSSEGL